MSFIIFAGVIILGIVLLKAGKKRPVLSKQNIPMNLGTLDHVPIQTLLNQLNTALNDEYIQQVKHRFLKENPRRTEDEFEWLLFELKRYFILANILKSAPMFSEQVDEIWHEMILFTKDYQSFSEKFLGKMLHHIPNTNPMPAPQERAFYDWVFSQLFQITEYSWKSWESFFRHPLSPEVLEDFKRNSNEELMDKYFERNEENSSLIEYLVNSMKKQVNEAEIMYRVNKKGSFTRQKKYGDMSALSLMMVFFSYYYFDHYWEYAKVYAFAHAANHTSGCTSAVFCGTASSDRSDSHGHSDGHHDGGGDSGGSSCSSCGGGCSS